MAFVRGRRCWPAALLVASLVTGCTHAVAGSARPAAGLKPNPLIGDVIKGVLLDDVVLANMLNQPFKGDPRLPPRFGGPEKLQPGLGDIAPAECAGVTTMTIRNAYESAEVKHVARETWWSAGESGKVISVAEAVVALPNAADASALFAEFSRQWNGCNGKTVTISGGALNFTDEVTDVRVDNSVLAATVYVQATGATAGRRPQARAIGLRVNCLVEVEVAFFSLQRSSDPGTGDPHTSAITIARAVMDKISARS
ncbi:sensor domain-containing protein [Mycobacterium asiaticum]|uniref:PknH-like extracellular domain-containing protein n=1 Tax=Mycobacterium asiaticum TaxID=1790 RepID=A0A1A3NBD5_MYCAS|nr:sensor domain-containing protein [Mycobacterium asiaticum]OBK19463.1 hypothetical protein A5636_18960 [Mycobacterium asiaticum]